MVRERCALLTRKTIPPPTPPMSDTQELLTSTADQILANYDAAVVGSVVQWYAQQQIDRRKDKKKGHLSERERERERRGGRGTCLKASACSRITQLLLLNPCERVLNYRWKPLCCTFSPDCVSKKTKHAFNCAQTAFVQAYLAAPPSYPNITTTNCNYN